MQVLQVLLVLHSFYLAERTGQADIRPQARHNTRKVIVMMPEDIRGHARRKWNPDLNVRVGIREPLRKHADNRVRLAVEMDLPVDNGWISAEAPLEETPRKHNGVPIRTIFALGERTSDRCVQPEQRKKIPAPATRLHQFGQFSALSCQVELPVAPCSHIFKAVSLSAPIVVVGRSNRVVVELLRIHAGVAEMLIDHHQTVWIAERKRPE